MFRRELILSGPAGALEALIEAPAEPPWERIALICHPHPLHGGTMRTTVVHRMARGLRRAGCATLRFNFRGVEGSAGEHDHGRGELEDARCALEELLRRSGGQPRRVVAAGFSFGARVALELGCAEPRVSHLLGVGLPLSLYPFDSLRESPKPKLLIQGERDEFADATAFLAFVARVRNPRSTHVIRGADHLFQRRAQEVEEVVAAWE